MASRAAKVRLAAALCLLALSGACPAGELSLSLTPALPEAAALPAPAPAAGDEAPIILHSTQSFDSQPAGGTLQVPGQPTPQELEARAQYWESHGRSDLAAKLRSQIKPAQRPAVVAPPRPAAPPPAHLTPSAPAQAPMPVGTTREMLVDQAQYWEAHGRDDLAQQIKQKLQDLGPPPLDNTAPARPQTANGVGVQSALEASLLKNPNSVNTRLDLVQIYRSTGELDKARAQVESALAASPDSPPALFLSAQLYADQRQWRATLDTLERVAPASRTSEMARLQKTAWAHVQLDRADALVKEGHNAEAEVLLRRVALELSIDASQPQLAEPPPLWKPQSERPPKKR